jgi:hypothetical protein
VVFFNRDPAVDCAERRRYLFGLFVAAIRRNYSEIPNSSIGRIKLWSKS